MRSSHGTDASFRAWPRDVCRGIGIGRRYTAWRDERFARIPDGYFAALAIEHGCEWISTDHYFARSPGLKWSHPLG